MRIAFEPVLHERISPVEIEDLRDDVANETGYALAVRPHEKSNLGLLELDEDLLNWGELKKRRNLLSGIIRRRTGFLPQLYIQEVGGGPFVHLTDFTDELWRKWHDSNQLDRFELAGKAGVD